ncbi:transmembrane protein 8B-like [Vespa velutina]|uniref:transmembrane protein 8B-like n=1 Tax=Vespa velutina TaxID=202808 RepID=UPI001FB481B5|nr:transmembrane protein 8B-like [Vespa velutina]XP_047353390.1 transmembrane protein 8B-like [Vespa velutina]XP_047353391.1 transmembrane protein 8B-like [Vespa velutina]XP_047353393.1 transmembrane protein 8B-like [Vespa velutina]XP_047353394.1 transmembrane protein 8B-like [Vespa velutina]XP_047353395.1 transmembrane protein 8B-like [Vespa velutina]
MPLYLIVLLIWSFTIQEGSCIKLKRIALRPSNILDDYYAYRHISIIHFDVPEYTITAGFKFTIKEEKTGGIGKCSPRYVSLYLKSGSLPLIRPDGSIIEAKLIKRRRKYYALNMQSNGDEHMINIDSPIPGDWYVIAFRSWTDPNSDKIKQQGLGASCDTVLDAELLIEMPSMVSLIDFNNEYEIELNKSKNTFVGHIFMSDDLLNVVLALNQSYENNCKFAIHVVAQEHLIGTIVNDTDVLLSFKPYSKSLHYITLRLISGNMSKISLRFENNTSSFIDFNQVKSISLIRKSLPEFFVFDYEHRSENDTKSMPFNLTSDGITVLDFEIARVYDVGGTVTVGIKMLNVDKKDQKNIFIVACITLGYYSNITAGGSCIRAWNVTGADIYVNETGPGLVHIPFPEPGRWYVSLKSFCVDGKCNCAENCLNGTICKECECMKPCSVEIESSISSSPCIEGRCNSHGKCMHYMSGGFVFSACYCTEGYRGFDCADGTYVLGNKDILVRLLMLTISNLAFIGSIYLAIRREYFTEAIVYTAVMFFSTFYHACEAGENVYSICIMRLSVLQFCDFFNALLSIWVTLVAMASFGPKLTAFFQIMGAIVLAMSSEMDRTALWVFLLPAITGSSLIGVSWGLRCKRRKTVRYPSRVYRTIFFPAGLLIVSLGLVCYAFLQTRSNYHIVHSLWHICVAVAVMLLLPKRHYMK